MIYGLLDALGRVADGVMRGFDNLCISWDNWLDKRRAAKAQRDYERGWDWAAGALLKGAAPEVIEWETDGDFRTSFDYGAEAAVSVWRSRDQVRRDGLFRVPDCCGSDAVH